MSKRVTKLLSLILTLVMFLSVTTPAFAFGGGDGLGDGWDRDIGEEEIRDFTDPVVEEEEEVDYFSASDANGLAVTVEAPMGALPTLAEVRAERVEAEEIRDAVESVVDGEPNILLALDISFWLYGREIEPELPVRVKIAAPELENKTNLTLVHIPDAAEPETVNLLPEEDLSFALGTNEIAFESSSFSVYAVVSDGDTGDYARVEVNFFNGETKIATMYVKNGDTLEELTDTILYDPGAGTIPAGQMFYGWTTNPEYTASKADREAALTIDDVRKAMSEMAIKEGMDPVNYYAMIFSAYSVSYLDEIGVCIRSDTLYAKAGEKYEGYEINEPYVPRDPDSNFEGWYKLDEDGNAVGEAIPNETVVDVEENLTLMAAVPRGNWLIFKEKGGSYTGPQFVKNGKTGVKPTDPTRKGYTFGGWYENEDYSGDQFDFSTVLTKRTVLYAKWNAVATANYTIIIWTENIACDGYDFAEAITKSGTCNTTVNTVTQRGSGRSTYVNISGTGDRSFEGFHVKSIDSNVTIVPEGTAVVNVYFDRSEYTYTFRSSSGNTTYQTVTRKFGTDITDIWSFDYNGTHYPTPNTSWEPQNESNAARITIELIMEARDRTFNHYSSNNTARQFYYYVEALPTDTDTREYDGKQYVLYLDLPNDFNVVYYNADFMEIDGFNRLAITDSNNRSVSISTSGTRWSSISLSYGATANTLYFYYSREKYPINFAEGVYVNKNGSAVAGAIPQTQGWGTSEDLYYNSDISSYNKGGSDYYDPTSQNTDNPGFVLEGWYLDSSCTKKCDFQTMPRGGLTVYAKWIQKQYRVFLHPNVTEAEDDSLDMGDQATCFAPAYGEQINGGNMILATREQYELIGWYTDPGLTKAFNFDAFEMNDTNVTTPYDQTEETELTTPYATVKPNFENYNKDADEGRFWITKKLDLYAKWRDILVGAEGITIVFDAKEGSFEGGEKSWTDPVLYKPGSQAPGAAAPAAPEGKQFKYWVLLNGSTGTFVPVDPETHILPGQLFEAKKAISEVKELDGSTPENPKFQYTIKLEAVYGEPEEETPTSVTWYSNIQDVEEVPMSKDLFTGETSSEFSDLGYFVVDDKVTDEDGNPHDLRINEALAIRSMDTFAYPGYKFLGWGRLDNADDAGATITSPNQLTKDNLFLKWVEASGEGDSAVAAHFEAKNSSGNWVPVTQIACDERLPHQKLVAVWEAQSFYVYHTSTCVIDEVKFNNEHMNGTTFDISALVPSGKLYGGYYSAYAGASFTTDSPFDPTKITSFPYTDSTGKAYATEENYPQFKSDDAYKVNGKAMTPVAGTLYYLKEVPNTYLMPTQIEIYNRYSKDLRYLILTTAFDDNNYKAKGFTVNGSTLEASLVDKITIEFGDNSDETSVDLGAKEVANNKVKGGLVSYNILFQLPYNEETGFDMTAYSPILTEDNKPLIETVKPFWTTPDGLTVTGSGIRRIIILDDNGDGRIQADGTEVKYRDYKSAITVQLAS